MSGLTVPCAACGALLGADHFEAGRAVMIGGQPFCAVCRKSPKATTLHRGRVPIFAMPARPLKRRRSAILWVAIVLLLAALAVGARLLLVRGT